MWKIRRKAIFWNKGVFSPLFYSKHYFLDVFLFLLLSCRISIVWLQHTNRFFNKSSTWIIHCYDYFLLNAQTQTQWVWWGSIVPNEHVCKFFHYFATGSVWKKCSILMICAALESGCEFNMNIRIQSTAKLNGKMKIEDIPSCCTQFAQKENHNEIWKVKRKQARANVMRARRSRCAEMLQAAAAVKCESTWCILNVFHHMVMHGIRLLRVYSKPDPISFWAEKDGVCFTASTHSASIFQPNFAHSNNTKISRCIRDVWRNMKHKRHFESLPNDSFLYFLCVFFSVHARELWKMTYMQQKKSQAHLKHGLYRLQMFHPFAFNLTKAWLFCNLNVAEHSITQPMACTRRYIFPNTRSQVTARKVFFRFFSSLFYYLSCDWGKCNAHRWNHSKWKFYFQYSLL